MQQPIDYLRLAVFSLNDQFATEFALNEVVSSVFFVEFVVSILSDGEVIIRLDSLQSLQGLNELVGEI